jgi:hypothetical protein
VVVFIRKRALAAIIAPGPGWGRGRGVQSTRPARAGGPTTAAPQRGGAGGWSNPPAGTGDDSCATAAVANRAMMSPAATDAVRRPRRSIWAGRRWSCVRRPRGEAAAVTCCSTSCCLNEHPSRCSPAVSSLCVSRDRRSRTRQRGWLLQGTEKGNAIPVGRTRLYGATAKALIGGHLPTQTAGGIGVYVLQRSYSTQKPRNPPLPTAVWTRHRIPARLPSRSEARRQQLEGRPATTVALARTHFERRVRESPSPRGAESCLRTLLAARTAPTPPCWNRCWPVPSILWGAPGRSVPGRAWPPRRMGVCARCRNEGGVPFSSLALPIMCACAGRAANKQPCALETAALGPPAAALGHPRRARKRPLPVQGTPSTARLALEAIAVLNFGKRTGGSRDELKNSRPAARRAPT